MSSNHSATADICVTKHFRPEMISIFIYIWDQVGHVQQQRYISHFSVFIQHGRTPLHLAANNGSLEVVRHLCLTGANIDAVTNVSHHIFSSLHWFPGHYSFSCLTYCTEYYNWNLCQAL